MDGFTGNDFGVSDLHRLAASAEGCDVLAVRSCSEFEPEWLQVLEEIHEKSIFPVGQLPTTAYDEGDDDNNKDAWREMKEKRCGLVDTALIELPDGFEKRTKEVGVICTSWVPQLKILSHDSVGGFWTHSGWSSVVEAIQFERALILLTYLADQGLNARLLEEKKIAYSIPRDKRDGSFTRDSLVESLRLIIVDEEGKVYTDKVKEMKGLFGSRDKQERSTKVGNSVFEEIIKKRENTLAMEQGVWIPVVKQRIRNEAWRKEVGKGLFSVFVDNVPSNIDPRALFKLFSKFGIVKDVFIPQKRRKATNTRFDCSMAATVAVQKANGLWVEDRELKVKMAEYVVYGSILSSEVEEVRSSNEVNKPEPVRVGGGDKTVENQAVEEEDDEVEVASSGDMALGSRLELTSKSNHGDTVVVETQSGVGNILVVEERMEMGVAEHSLEANDDNLRVEEQLVTPGFVGCLSGSIGQRPGINLEVNLGHILDPVENNRMGLVVRGPNTQSTSISNWASIRPNMYQVQTNPDRVIDSIYGVKKSTNKGKGKERFSTATKSITEVKGYSSLARCVGLGNSCWSVTMCRELVCDLLVAVCGVLGGCWFIGCAVYLGCAVPFAGCWFTGEYAILLLSMFWIVVFWLLICSAADLLCC
ncbi:hypothetical protein ACSBR1_024906 [Camellia fascicularis]